ncbi:MAG: hypothetical protein ACLFVS_05280 [Candidatus Acetothermia bacterium]
MVSAGIPGFPYPFNTYLRELTDDLVVVFDGGGELVGYNRAFLHLAKSDEADWIEFRSKKYLGRLGFRNCPRKIPT